MTRDGFSYFLDFQKFFGGGPPNLPSRLEKYEIYFFNPTLLNTSIC